MATTRRERHDEKLALRLGYAAEDVELFAGLDRERRRTLLRGWREEERMSGSDPLVRRSEDAAKGLPLRDRFPFVQAMKRLRLRQRITDQRIRQAPPVLYPTVVWVERSAGDAEGLGSFGYNEFGESLGVRGDRYAEVQRWALDALRAGHRLVIELERRVPTGEFREIGKRIAAEYTVDESAVSLESEAPSHALEVLAELRRAAIVVLSSVEEHINAAADAANCVAVPTRGNFEIKTKGGYPLGWIFRRADGSWSFDPGAACVWDELVRASLAPTGEPRC